MKLRREGQPLALSAPKYETSARKETQKQNSTLSILDIDVALSMKYLVGHTA